MTSLAKIKARLVEDEGKVGHAYQDHLGFWTIGVGRLIDQRKDGGLSEDEIQYLLDNDIRKAEAIARIYPWYADLSWERQGVILCMIFQLGRSGLNAFVRMRVALERKDFDAAAAEMLDSKWAKEDTPARAERMARVMKTGVWL